MNRPAVFTKGLGSVRTRCWPQEQKLKLIVMWCTIFPFQVTTILPGQHHGTPSGTITVHGSAQKRPHSGPITFHGKYPLQGAAETRTWVARIRCLPLDQKLKLIVVVHHISDKCSRILFQKVVMADVRSTFVLPCRMGQNTEI